MKLPIRLRLTLAFGLIFAVLLATFSVVVYFLMSSSLERELIKDTEHDMTQVLRVFNHGNWASQLAEMPEESEEFKLNIQLLDNRGEILYRTEGVQNWDWPVDKAILDKALQKPIWSDTEINEVSHLVLTHAVVSAGSPLHFVQVANSRHDINKIRNRLITCINVGTPVILIVALLMGQFFSKKALAPVEKIRERAQAFKPSNLGERLVYNGPEDELSRLTDTLNNLFERIQTSVNQTKRFIADASHELRIPLTGLRGTMEVALRKDRTAEEYKRVIEDAHEESQRLSELVWELLSLARADAGEMALDIKPVDLPSFFKHLEEAAQHLNSEKSVEIIFQGMPSGNASFDEMKIHQLLLNLIENAIKYNKPGGQVILKAQLDPNKLSVFVEDTGVGISKEDQTKVFDRFFRVDKARSRETGGTGLGLSIARSIAEAHKGTLTVQSESGKGSIFQLTLPLV
ncbi:MAG: Sensor kinase CusS [Elusimicrobia bacterium]|nr:Sensor kinase CusS [Elusimicrobiota bacterium]